MSKYVLSYTIQSPGKKSVVSSVTFELSSGIQEEARTRGHGILEAMEEKLKQGDKSVKVYFGTLLQI